MYGKIHFIDEEALAKFLIAFVGSTAKFTVYNGAGGYTLEFEGGY